MNSAKYARLLKTIKARTQSARARAAIAVNAELVTLFWQIGRELLARQNQQGWGTKVVDSLSRDLLLDYPNMRGYSPRNLNYMLAFARAYPKKSIVQTVSAKLTWSHNTALLDKVKSGSARDWYARQALEHGWSLNVLHSHIAADLYGSATGASRSSAASRHRGACRGSPRNSARDTGSRRRRRRG